MRVAVGSGVFLHPADVVLLGQAAVTPGDLTLTVLTELYSHAEGGWTKTLGPSAL